MMRDYYGSEGRDGRSSREAKLNDPPNSRLFIVCGKSITEDEFKDCFSKYGTVSEVRLVKDRASGESKGIAYIKFNKTSEAALAMEEMNGKCVENHPRPLKVLIANSREQGSRRDQNEEERLLRLFVVVPRIMSELKLREEFEQYGDIDYCSIVKDRNTKESKGFGYVKYHRVSHAAIAFESCDRTFKPMFADPKPQKETHSMMRSDVMMSGPGSSVSSSGYDMPYSSGMGKLSSPPPLDVMMNASGGSLHHHHHDGGGSNRLSALAPSMLTRQQLWKLFDLVPGLEYVDLRGTDRKTGQGHVVVHYNNIQSAGYARDKIHGFEYPPGHRISVKFDGGGDHGMQHQPMLPPPMMDGRQQMMAPPLLARHPHQGPPPAGQGPSSGPPAVRHSGNLQNDLAHLAETIAQATSLIQAAGISPHGHGGGSNMTAPSGGAGGGSGSYEGAGGAQGDHYDPSYCSVKLPPPQPLAAYDSNVEERLFIVYQPSPPPLYAIKDTFARFGGLIDTYVLNGKNVGYAKYSTKESAEKAQVTLHGQELCGSRLKVMKADPDKTRHEGTGSDAARKRIKIDDQQM